MTTTTDPWADAQNETPLEFSYPAHVRPTDVETQINLARADIFLIRHTNLVPTIKVNGSGTIRLILTSRQLYTKHTWSFIVCAYHTHVMQRLRKLASNNPPKTHSNTYPQREHQC